MPNLTRTQALAELTRHGQPYELAETVIAGEHCRVFVKAPRSLRELYEETLSDETFLVYGEERLTFQEAHRQAAQIGRLLVDRYAFAPGDRVAISMRNYPEWMTIFTAVTSVGGIAVPMNALWQPDEMDFALQNCGAKILFADQERLDRLAAGSGHPSLGVIAVRPSRTDCGAPVLANLLAEAGEGPMPPVEVEPDDDATIFYTSGSTGHSKGVVSTHRNILGALLSWELDGRIGFLTAGNEPSAQATPSAQQAALLAVPLFHVTGSHAVFLLSFRSQRKIVSMYKWDVELAAELIERERITTFVAPPAMTGDLVQAARRTQRDLSSLMIVGGGGAPRAPEQVKDIHATTGGIPVTGWGMTETNAIGTGISGGDYLERPNSSGRCAAVLDLRVVGEDGQELPAGTPGELLVRGSTVFDGYWNLPEVNAEVFVDGWFRTGDVAILDEEGFLFIVDRIKDLIIRGGENIGCGQVEAAILEHPDVIEACVYAVPDERLGEEVGATVYSSEPLEADALRAFLSQRLARFQVPRYLRFSTRPLPRTASGKIFKKQLQEEAIAPAAIAGGGA